MKVFFGVVVCVLINFQRITILAQSTVRISTDTDTASTATTSRDTATTDTLAHYSAASCSSQPDPPIAEIIIPEKTSVTTIWLTNQTDFNCVPSILLVDCVALIEDNPNGQEWVKNGSNINSTADINERTIVIIEDLSEFTNYTCNGTVNSTDGKTSSTTIGFRTKEEVPSEPRNLVVSRKTNTNWAVTWEKPIKNPGVFINYQVHISSTGPNHFVPESCPKHEVDEWHETIEELYVFNGASPDYGYEVTIFATNGAGNGTGATINVTTNTAAPDEPRDFYLEGTDLDVESNIISQNFSWRMPCNPNGPIDRFQIDLEGYYILDNTFTDPMRQIYINTSDTENYYVEIKDFMPASNYSISIRATRGTETGVSFNTSLVTPDNFPGRPIIENITEKGSNFFTISWREPERRAGNITNYKVNIISLRPRYDQDPNRCQIEDKSVNETLEGETMTYNFTEGHPFYQYNVSVTAVTTIGPGNPSYTIAETESSKPEKPVDLQFAIINNNQTGSISWLTPCNVNGPIKGFEIMLNGKYTVDNFVSVNSTESIIFGSSTEKYSYNISLLESHRYVASVWIVLTDGTTGDVQETNITTPDGYPGAPSNTNYSEVDEKSFVISWTPPSSRTGRITKYQINVTALGPLYKTHCLIDNGSTIDTIDGTIDMYRFEQGQPYYNYSVLVKAKTIRGLGPSDTEISIQTKQSIPENVQRLKHSVSPTSQTKEEYDAHVYISFEEPCKLNGPLKNYQLTLLGVRDSYENHILEPTTTETSFNISLRPEYDYTYSIGTLTASFNNTSDKKTFAAPAGVPQFANSLLDVKIDAGSFTATVIIKREYFDEMNGAIQYVALILTDQNVSGGEFESWDATHWPLLNRSDAAQYYQITQKWWEPFIDSPNATIYIGHGVECEESQTYCNKPLESDKEYYLIIRIFNKNFFRNSPAIHFHTAAISNLGTILGVIFGLLAFALLGTIGFIMWKRNMIDLPAVFNPRKSSVKSMTNITAIPIYKFVHYYKNLENNPEKLAEQYALLSDKTKEAVRMQTCTIAELTENRRKNRYTNILPYDNTRVKLLIDEDDEIGSDYINASYITGYSSQNEYIATQGPLPSTCRDFWKMVIQENVSIIVMVTQFIEKDKEKCFKYFPNNHESMPVGEDMEVKCTMELHFGTYCVRILQVKKDTTQVTVTHMQYLDWPDFGVPTGTDTMLQFCYQIRERLKMDGGYVIVHCSAGVGRTGTLIATDILLQNINAGKDIDVFKTVLELRKQRTNMVQTQKQYMYIHSLLKDSLDHSQAFGSNDNPEPLYENTSALKMKTDDDNLITKGAESESKF